MIITWLPTIISVLGFAAILWRLSKGSLMSQSDTALAQALADVAALKQSNADALAAKDAVIASKDSELQTKDADLVAKDATIADLTAKLTAAQQAVDAADAKEAADLAQVDAAIKAP